jgi:hypothetical protein
MREKTVTGRYKYYKSAIEKLGEFSLLKNPRIDDLKLTRGVIQAGYKDMFKIDFDGTIIDYLCYVSTLYLAELLKQGYPLEEQVAKVFFKDYVENKYNIRNTVRLYQKYPYYFLNSIDDKIWNLSDEQRAFKESHFNAISEDPFSRSKPSDHAFLTWSQKAGDIICFVNFVVAILLAVEWKGEVIGASPKGFNDDVLHELNFIDHIVDVFRDKLRVRYDNEQLWRG